MTDDIVTRLAREAELVWFKSNGEARLMMETEDADPMPDFRRFAALVAEECAKVCEAVFLFDEQQACGGYLSDAAEAIRAKFKA